MGKTALITGASRGIGKAIALRLAKDGYDIAVNFNSNQEAAAKTAAQIAQYGVTARIYQADTSKMDEVKAMFKAIRNDFGGLGVLVNNAGIVDDAYLLMVNQPSLEKSLAINIQGYINCAQQAALRMAGAGKGIIINISSVSSVIAVEGQTVYSATKGAVNSMTATMAKELAPRGIRVNAVAPGFVGTDMLKSIPGDLVDKYIESIPMKKFGTAEDVANVVSSLCSDNFSYMTGQVLVLDGGLSL